MSASTFNYESMLRWRAQWLQRQMQGKLLVRSSDRSFEDSRQALLKRYVTFDFTPDTALINWSVFVNDVKQHSGRHRHQGGLVLFVLAGDGSTEIDGTRYPWKRGDLLLLPIRPGGIAHKHYNHRDGAPCRWVAFYYRPFEDLVCHTMTHLEDVHAAGTSEGASGTGSRFEEPANRSPAAPLPSFYLSPEEVRGQNLFEALTRLRDAQRDRRRSPVCVLSGADLPWELNAHGFTRWYLHPLFLHTAVRTFSAYLQYLPPGSRSGRQQHPGDKVFFTLQGKGHTVIDGVSYAWGPEDLLMLPIRPEGVTYQHFNDDPSAPAYLFACEPNLAFTLDLDRGSRFEELEPAPEYSAGGGTTEIEPPLF